MRRNRHFKQRQSNRIDYMIMQEQAADQLRREQEQAEVRLQNELDALDVVERATKRAFQSIETKALREVGA
jgi:hypothetical protein